MKIFISLAFCLFFGHLFAQSGTLIIVAIIDEGIVIAADSRGSFYPNNNNTGEPYAYFDSARKIFRLKQFTLAISGAFVAGYTYYNAIVDNFNKTSFYDTGLENTLKGFIAYLDKKFPADSFPERKSNGFFAGGYVNGHPEIIGMDSARKVVYRDRGNILSDSGANKYAMMDSKQPFSPYQNMENTIYDFAKGENKTNKVGGPISIVLIKPKNQLVWIKNNFSSINYKSLNEFYQAFKNDNIKMHYLVPNGKEVFLNNFRH